MEGLEANRDFVLPRPLILGVCVWTLGLWIAM
jgi:hypothetical protein